MEYHQGPPIGRDGKKRRKWITRLEVEPARIIDPMGVHNAYIGCREAANKINQAVAARDRRAAAVWRRKLEERAPELRAMLRKSGHTWEPKIRENIQIMDRELTKLLRPRPRRA